MKIRTKLYAAALIPLFAGILLALVLVSAFHDLSRATAHSRLVSQLVRDAFNLHTLAGEYRLHGSVRVVEQWDAVQAVLDNHLRQIRPDDRRTAELVSEMRGHLDAANAIFRQLGEPIDTAAAPDAAYASATAAERQGRLLGQMFTRLQFLAGNAALLDTLTHKRMEEIGERTLVLVLGCILAAAAGAALFSWLMGRSILRPIRRLQEGAEVIGRGNLNHRVGLPSPDEVGELSRAFDRMTLNLRELTASRDELNREVEQRQAAEQRLRQTLQELEQSSRQLETFAYAASHDVQEPLHTISGYADLLHRRHAAAMDPEARDFLNYVREGAQRAQAMVKGLLEYSRLSTRGEPLAPVSSEAALSDALQSLRRTIEDTGALVEHTPLPRVAADAGQLAQLFQNLVGNAIKFRRDGEKPHVRITCERADGEWIFQVRDNGIGIDPAQSDRIFGIFQRLHPPALYPGTGVGLALCQRIVERHGGRIWVESEPGRGAAFLFTIPALAQAPDEPRAASAGPPASAPAPNNGTDAVRTASS